MLFLTTQEFIQVQLKQLLELVHLLKYKCDALFFYIYKIWLNSINYPTVYPAEMILN